MIVLGVDQSTKTGVVCLKSTIPNVMCVTYNKEQSFPKLRGVPRIDAFHKYALKLYADLKPDIIVFEGYGYASNTLAISVGVGTALRLAAHELKIPFIEVPPTSLKLFVLGKGVGKKDIMMKEAYKRWKFEGTDNEVDAYCLACFAMSFLGKLTMPKGSTKAFAKLSEDNLTVLNLFK